MTKLQIKKTQTGNKLSIELIGTIDESAAIATLSTEGISELILDVGGVETINSFGVREWLKWIRTIPPGAQFKVLNCPRVFIDQVNSIAGFLPKGAKIQSFSVPYYCDACGASSTLLFSEGKEFIGGKVVTSSHSPCLSCASQAAWDIEEKSYFKFLSTHA